MNLRNAYRTILAGLLTLAIITAINTNNTFATASTLTLSISNSTVSMNMAPTNTNGSFSKSSATTISASTTNATGYTLSISAPTGAGSDYDKLINSTDNTAKLNSITASTTEEQFKALSGTAYNNMWGYLPSKYCSDGTTSTCASNTLFLPAPTTAGDILDQTSVANTTANTYTLGMGARIDSTTKTGSYSNSYVVKLVGNAIPYTITYDDSIVSNMPTDVDSTSTSTTVQISSNIPTRAGYQFLGWCSGTVTTTSGTDSCSGTTYAPGSNYTLDQTGGANNLSLIAMWKEVKTIANATYLQEVGACPSTLTTGQVYTLKDSRDEQQYKVAKLADNKCWMLENLNLAGGTAIEATKSNVDASYISSFSTSNNLTKDTTNNAIVLPASSTSGFDTNNYSYVYNSGNKTNCGASGQNTPCYSYYSWDAATLGSGRSISTDNTDAPYSICPKGWKLPSTYNGSGTAAEATDFRALMIGYGGSNSVQTYNSSTTPTGATMYGNIGPGTTPNFLLAGFYYYGSLISGGSSGRYWSSTSNSDTNNARYLYFDSGGVYSANSYSRYYGSSVRCLLAE